ncbi:MAG: hypothetical protein M3422_25670 [Actinomycetota bacterium]|nr:hypothetical protein [Actinomycetota bacterium]
MSADLAPVLELRAVGLLLAGNGVPADLPSVLREVAAGVPGGEVVVIFDDDDRYLGSPTEAVRHGVAPGLGEPPSRMLD